MNLQTYHNNFKGKSLGDIARASIERLNRGGVLGVVNEVMYYCCPTKKPIGTSYIYSRPMLYSDVHPDVTPDVTPEMLADFILANGDKKNIIAILIVYSRYENIGKVIEIILERNVWVLQFSEFGTKIIPGDADDGVVLGFDEFIFMVDVLAENDYANSDKYQISIDYFPEFNHQKEFQKRLNRNVKVYKKMCVKHIKC